MKDVVQSSSIHSSTLAQATKTSPSALLCYERNFLRSCSLDFTSWGPAKHIDKIVESLWIGEKS